MSYLRDRCRCQLFFVISLQVLFIECLLHSICQITSFSSVVYSIFLQCADTKRIKIIQPPTVSFRMLSFSHTYRSHHDYLTPQTLMNCLSKSIGVMFLFVFPQFPSSVEHNPTLITSHIRRTVSCSKSYLWRSHYHRISV